MHTTSERGTTADLLFLTKGGKLRVDVPNGHGGPVARSIFDPATQKITGAHGSARDGDGAARSWRHYPGRRRDRDQPTNIARTGKHETIAGYDCEDWDVTMENGKRVATCVAQGLAFFDFSGMAGPTGGGTRSWAEELRDKNGFPLRAVETDASGKEVSRMEVTKIEKKRLDDSTFAIPRRLPRDADAREWGMGQGMQGLGAGGAPHPGRCTRRARNAIPATLRDRHVYAATTVKAKLTALVALSIVVMLAALPILSWTLHRRCWTRSTTASWTRGDRSSRSSTTTSPI